MPTTDNVSDYMTDYVKKIAEDMELKGKEPGYAHAVAWSIACKYHPEYDHAGHCAREGRQYLTRKANRRILTALHRACNGLAHGGELMYWAAMSQGIRTKAFEHRGHIVLVYNREAFGPTVRSGEALQDAVTVGHELDMGHQPSKRIAAELEELFPAQPRRNPDTKLSLAKKDPAIDAWV